MGHVQHNLEELNVSFNQIRVINPRVRDAEISTHARTHTHLATHTHTHWVALPLATLFNIVSTHCPSPRMTSLWQWHPLQSLKTLNMANNKLDCDLRPLLVMSAVHP